MGCMFFSNFSCQPYVINIQLCNTDNICTDLYILLKPQSKLGYLGANVQINTCDKYVTSRIHEQILVIDNFCLPHKNWQTSFSANVFAT